MSIINSNSYLLYADDDADDRMLMVETLEKFAPDMTVKTLNDGPSTIEFLKNQTPPLPCLLILDLNMPGMNGKEVIKKLKKHEFYSTLPIVVFTTSANPADRAECESYGVDMITKPFDLDEFKNTACRLLEYCQ